MKIRWKRAAAILLTAAMLPFENVADCFVLRAQAAQYMEAESVLDVQEAIDGQNSADDSGAEAVVQSGADVSAQAGEEEAASAGSTAAESGEDDTAAASEGAGAENAGEAASENTDTQGAASENAGTEGTVSESAGTQDAASESADVVTSMQRRSLTSEAETRIPEFQLDGVLDDCGIAQLYWSAEIPEETEEWLFEIYRDDELYTVLEGVAADEDGYFRFSDEDLQGDRTYRYYVEICETEEPVEGQNAGQAEKSISSTCEITTPQAMVLDGQDLFLQEDMVLFSLEMTDAKLNLNEHSVKILRDCTLRNSKLDFQYGELVCSGNMTVDSSDLEMEYERERLFVGKNFLASVSWMEWNGTCEVRGDVSFFGEYIYCGYNSSLILSGETKQNVSIAEEFLLNRVEICNTAEEGIILDAPVSCREMNCPEECNVSYVGFEGIKGWTLEEDEVYEGDLILGGGTLDLSGHQLTVTGDLIHSFGKIVFNGGCLTVEGDYQLQFFKELDGERRYSCGTGVLVMNREEDKLLINKDCFIESNSFNSGYDMNCGSIEILGDLNCVKGDCYFPESVAVIFSGDRKQTIRQEDSSAYLSFGKLCITNSSEEGIVIEDDEIRVSQIDLRAKKIEGGIKPDNLSGYIGCDVTIRSRDYGSIGGLTVDGDLLLEGYMSLDYASMNVTGNLMIPMGRFSTYRGNLNIDGDLLMDGGILIMQNDQDAVLIGGNLINRSNFGYNTLYQGTFEVKGDIVSKGGFRADGSNRILLSGDKKQSISVEDEDEFAIVELKNSSSEGVEANCYFNVKQLIENDCRISYLQAGHKLNEDTLIEGDLVLTEEFYDLNGQELHICGDLIQEGGLIDINGGKLIVDGDYRIQTRAEENGVIRYGSSNGRLIMNDMEDYVFVKGNLYIDAHEDSAQDYMAGTLEVSGDVTVLDTENSRGYFPSGKHKLLLSGEKEQKLMISGSSASSSHVNNLEITNSGEKGVVIEEKLYVCGEVNDHMNRVGGEISIANSTTFTGGHFGGSISVDQVVSINRNLTVDGDFTINGSLSLSKEAAVKGNFTIAAGYLEMSGGKLTVDGDFVIPASSQNAYLKMNGEEDYILVKGNTEFNPSDCFQRYYPYNDYLTNGVFEVKGDFNSTRQLRTAYKHIFLLSGDKKQTVTAGNSASFSVIEVSNTSAEGVEFKDNDTNNLSFKRLINRHSRVVYQNEVIEKTCVIADTWDLVSDERIEGDLIVLYKIDLGGRSMEVLGDLIARGTIEGNGADLQVAENFIHESGILKMNGGNLKIGGDYRVQGRQSDEDPAQYEAGYGRFLFGDQEASVTIGGDFISCSRIAYDEALGNCRFEVGGDFIVDDTNADRTFVTGPEFVLVLNGNKKQKVSLGKREDNKNNIRNLILNNNTEFEDCPLIEGSIRTNGNDVEGSIRVGAYTVFEDDFGGSIYCNDNLWGTPLSIGGDLILAGGSYEINRNISVGGNLRLENGANYTIKAGTQVNVAGDAILRGSLTDRGSLTVGGNMLFEENGALQLQSGNAEVSGDLTMDGFGY
ncbi:MAG: hypothetical protein J6Z35_06190, partial [Lachnospiraceae bacterium]|nr:hypothetical protein [Lachnospiraceae bacterium]